MALGATDAPPGEGCMRRETWRLGLRAAGIGVLVLALGAGTALAMPLLANTCNPGAFATRFCFVGGGDGNTASKPYSAVLGGQGNAAGGIAAAVGGGNLNVALAV